MSKFKLDEFQTPQATRIAANCRVLSVDIRGFSRSKPPKFRVANRHGLLAVAFEKRQVPQTESHLASALRQFTTLMEIDERSPGRPNRPHERPLVQRSYFDVPIPNFISMVLETNVALFVLAELDPVFEFAGCDLRFPIVASQFSLNHFLTV